MVALANVGISRAERQRSVGCMPCY
jgi:hypothetical protein